MSKDLKSSLRDLEKKSEAQLKKVGFSQKNHEGESKNKKNEEQKRVTVIKAKKQNLGELEEKSEKNEMELRLEESPDGDDEKEAGKPETNRVVGSSTSRQTADKNTQKPALQTSAQVKFEVDVEVDSGAETVGTDNDEKLNKETIVRDLYLYLESDNGVVTSGQLIELLEIVGFTRADPRLNLLRKRLRSINGLRKDAEMDFECFNEMVKGSTIFLMKALKGQLAIPDFVSFREDMESIYDACEHKNGGNVATYIPQLAKADPNLYAISVCTVDGQILNLGDKDVNFCIQSCCKPISYLMAVQENGFDEVNFHIGREPSGTSFNNLGLKDYPSEKYPNKKIPHNPMINAGAIMSCAMIKRSIPMADRFSHVMDTWERLCSSSCGFDNTVYLSEKDSADRNWCLGYMMQEFHSFPDPHGPTTLENTLQFYFQQCSITANCSQMAIMAATLANGGENPLSGDKIFDPFHVRNVLSLMLTCGMYDYSGEWCFTVGLPAKSGVAGCVWAVVPNKVGIATYSPPLDQNGNSFKSIAVYKEIVSVFNFHQYDSLKGVTNSRGLKPKKDPTSRPKEEELNHTTALLFACFEGDLTEIKRLCSNGADIWCSDYDQRTPLHLACSEGHVQVVRYMIRLARNDPDCADLLSPEDRWGRSPLDDAISGEHKDVQKLMRKYKARRGAGENNSCTFNLTEHSGLGAFPIRRQSLDRSPSNKLTRSMSSPVSKVSPVVDNTPDKKENTPEFLPFVE